MSGVKLGGRESDLTIPECGLAIMVGRRPKLRIGEIFRGTILCPYVMSHEIII